VKPLTIKQHDRLAEALAWIDGPMCHGRGAEHAIQQLIRVFRASRRQFGRNNVLSCLGVEGRCSWSDCEGLLDAWVRLARERLGSAKVLPARGDLRQAGVFAQPDFTPSSQESSEPSLPGRTATGAAKGGPVAEKPHVAPGTALTKRERAVLEMTTDGMRSVSIGEALGISARTVEHHRANAIVRLGARNIVHAAVIFDRAERAAAQPIGNHHA